MIISDFHRFGGKHTETSALKNVLEYQGVVAPHTRDPYSEALLFGIGGGIGFAYFLFEKNGAHPIHLGTRVHTRETEHPEFFRNITRRISVSSRVQNSSSATAAEANLKRHLQRGQPPIISVDPARLPHLGLHAPVYTYYCVIVYGMDEDSDRMLLSGRSQKPLSVTRDELRAARETSWSPKYRAVLVEGQQAEPDLESAVREGIRNCCQQMSHGLGISNFGIRGLGKWATVLTSAREKSWPKIFSPGATLFEALYSIFVQISGRSDTGHANRAFYADFLDEAAAILSAPGLRDVAELYRNCDRMWDTVANAHLPDSVPLFREAKELTLRRQVLFESEGTQASDELQSIRKRLEEIAQTAAEHFPLSFQESRSLLNDLRFRILNLRDAEAEALRALESAIGGGSTAESLATDSEQQQDEHRPVESVGP